MYVEHTPQIRVHLTKELRDRVEQHGLSPSELLERAIQDELQRRELDAATDRYLAELIDEVGEPSAEALAQAEALMNRIRTVTA